MCLIIGSCRKILTGCWVAVTLLAVCCGYAIGEQPKPRDYWPTNGWEASTPENQGMDTAKLSIADEFVRKRLPDAYSLLVVRNGYLVFEKYYAKGHPDRYAAVHSVTKSVMATLVGIALEKGYLTNVDQKIENYFPEYFTGEVDPRKKEITIAHLLTMSAGFMWDDWGPELYEFIWSEDPARYAINRTQVNDPGMVFNYNSSISHLLSVILTKASDTNTFEFADQYLFKPLGIRHRSWNRDTQGFYYGGFGLALSARDLAKIGFLYLNNGYWDGRSIVQEAWVKASTRHQIQARAHPIYGWFAYGYQWWVTDVDGFSSYRAWGRRGQFIVVVPKLDLVIAVTSDPGQPHPPTSIHYTPLFELVAAAVKRERPPKKPLIAVDLPPDVKAFITDYNQARYSLDILKMSEMISDDFLFRGVTKDLAVKFLSGTMSYTREAEIVITRYNSHGETADIDVWLKDKYFQSPFMIGTRLIKEKGHWKWYGNQLQR